METTKDSGRPAPNDGAPMPPDPPETEAGAPPACALRASSVPFLERGPRQCAWPLWGDATPRGERLVCGAPTRADGGSWCARHALLVWKPGEERGTR